MFPIVLFILISLVAIIISCIILSKDHKDEYNVHLTTNSCYKLPPRLKFHPCSTNSCHIASEQPIDPSLKNIPKTQMFPPSPIPTTTLKYLCYFRSNLTAYNKNNMPVPGGGGACYKNSTAPVDNFLIDSNVYWIGADWNEQHAMDTAIKYGVVWDGVKMTNLSPNQKVQKDLLTSRAITDATIGYYLANSGRGIILTASIIGWITKPTKPGQIGIANTPDRIAYYWAQFKNTWNALYKKKNKGTAFDIKYIVAYYLIDEPMPILGGNTSIAVQAYNNLKQAMPSVQIMSIQNRTTKVLIKAYLDFIDIISFDPYGAGFLCGLADNEMQNFPGYAGLYQSFQEYIEASLSNYLTIIAGSKKKYWMCVDGNSRAVDENYSQFLQNTTSDLAIKLAIVKNIEGIICYNWNAKPCYKNCNNTIYSLKQLATKLNNNLPFGPTSHVGQFQISSEQIENIKKCNELGLVYKSHNNYGNNITFCQNNTQGEPTVCSYGGAYGSQQPCVETPRQKCADIGLEYHDYDKSYNITYCCQSGTCHFNSTRNVCAYGEDAGGMPKCKTNSPKPTCAHWNLFSPGSPGDPSTPCFERVEIAPGMTVKEVRKVPEPCIFGCKQIAQDMFWAGKNFLKHTTTAPCNRDRGHTLLSSPPRSWKMICDGHDTNCYFPTPT